MEGLQDFKIRVMVSSSQVEESRKMACKRIPGLLVAKSHCEKETLRLTDSRTSEQSSSSLEAADVATVHLQSFRCQSRSEKITSQGRV